jgi:excisionase family DNA binding protein
VEAHVKKPRKLLSVEEFAAEIGVRRTTAFGIVGRGEIESVKIGRLRRIPAEAVDAYVESLRQEQTGGHAA